MLSLLMNKIVKRMTRKNKDDNRLIMIMNRRMIIVTYYSKSDL